MRDYSEQNRKAWEYNAYEFWVRNSGTPAKRPWGAVNMSFYDPDNNMIFLRSFSQE